MGKQLLPSGQAISVQEANDEIAKFSLVQNELKKLIVSGSLPAASIARDFIGNLCNTNVFIFDIDLIERFKGAKELTHYAICSGFNDNGSTVIFGGFNLKTVNGKVELHTVKPTQDPDNSLSEHPQKILISSLIENNFQGEILKLTIE